MSYCSISYQKIVSSSKFTYKSRLDILEPFKDNSLFTLIISFLVECPNGLHLGTVWSTFHWRVTHNDKDYSILCVHCIAVPYDCVVLLINNNKDSKCQLSVSFIALYFILMLKEK